MLEGGGSAHEMAYQLQLVEQAVLAERMCPDFLTRRQQWVLDVQQAQRGSDLSFEHVHTLASELFAGIQNPQTATALVQVLRNWMPTREKDRLPIDICMLIMRHVIQCDAIDMLLAPLLSVFTPPPGPSSTVYSFMQDAVRFS